MPKIHSRHHSNIIKGNDNGSIMPLHQTVATLGYKSFYTIPQQPAPSSNSLSTGKYLYFDLESYETDTIEDICFRWTISNTGASDVELVPSAYFINRIVIEAEKGTGQELSYIYPEQIIFHYWTVLTNEERERWASLSNFGIGRLNSKGEEKLIASDSTILRAGETKDIYMPIPVAFLHLHAIDPTHLISDLRFRIELNNDFVISGTSTDVSLDNLNLFILSPQEAEYDKASRKTANKRAHHKYVYLDAERLTYNDKTLTAGSYMRWNMDQFVGKSPFLVVFLKGSTAPQASDKTLFNYLEMGPDALFDLENSSGRSLWGNGSPIKESEVYQNFLSKTSNRPLQGCYVIDFSDDMRKSLAGVINGIHSFNGQNDYLRIDFPTAALQETQTITLNAALTSGLYYFINSRDSSVSNAIAWDSNNNDMTNAINAMPAVKSRGYTATVDTTFDASATVTITFSNADGKVSDEIGQISIVPVSTNALTSIDTETTQYGKKGFTTGSNYQIEIFLYKFKELTVTKSGRLITKDL